MPQQQYIKHLYEKEDFSVNKISQAMGINWRTAVAASLWCPETGGVKCPWSDGILIHKEEKCPCELASLVIPRGRVRQVGATENGS